MVKCLTESAQHLTHLKSPQYLVRFTRVLDFFISFIMVRDTLEMAIIMHLRSETRPPSIVLHVGTYAPANRPTVAPSTAKSLLEAGSKVNIERSTVRIFEDSEFEAVGLMLVKVPGLMHRAATPLSV